MLRSLLGIDHTDPQETTPADHAPTITNTTAAITYLVMGTAAGITIVTLALILAEPLGKVASGALVAWGTLFVVLGIRGFMATTRRARR